MLINFFKHISWPALVLSLLGFTFANAGTRFLFDLPAIGLGILCFFIGLLVYLINAFWFFPSKAQQELSILKAQLKQAEPLAAVGYLSAGIAHELKNPLNFILNFSELSLELIGDMKSNPTSPELVDELKMNIQTTLNHAKRAESIMRNILLYANGSHQPQKQKTDINQLLEECFQLSFHAEKSHYQNFNVKVIKKFDDRVREFPAYKEEIGRAFINIINNALYALHQKNERTPDFMPTLELSTECKDNIVLIHIRDNGPGIPKDSLKKIFQPFYSTKPSRDGTGLGLAITQDVIKKHGGTITVTSTLNEFTDFLLTIPFDKGVS